MKGESGINKKSVLCLMIKAVSFVHFNEFERELMKDAVKGLVVFVVINLTVWGIEAFAVFGPHPPEPVSESISGVHWGSVVLYFSYLGYSAWANWKRAVRDC